MQSYILKRALLFIPTLFLVSVIIFVILRLVPGDPAIQIAGGAGLDEQFSEEDLQKIRKLLGTDRPLIIQYGDWAGSMFKLDFGESFTYRAPVWDKIWKRFPTTLELTILALLMSGVVAVPLGILSAIKQDSIGDYASRIITIAGIAVPNFWVAILMLFVLSNVFSWAPPIELESFTEDPLANLKKMIFPAIALSFTHMAFMARVTRSSTLEVFREDYIRTARAKGLSEMTVIGRHALKNALLPVITVAGYEFGRLIGGTVIIEQVFVVQGMGKLLIDSLFDRDYPMIQGIVMVITVIVLVLNLAIDIMYAWLNPRIRYA